MNKKEKILNYLKHNLIGTRKQIAQAIDYSESATYSGLMELLEENQVDREQGKGRKPDTYYLKNNSKKTPKKIKSKFSSFPDEKIYTKVFSLDDLEHKEVIILILTDRNA
ncbi:hypothetical protein FRE64_16920 (plasmid) [Euhalothece natronophila Z-M001]|uniref:Uncharacterized protein n=1 Tax=Euhalothece natronophila Z-M001 TaxID=522448 RepID=A0A5B8NRG0_9CHRO|nr:hypothetical protein [Euhalothece natronophila]QDZ41636.1 hypothetical protein FRE64_16820 [Euhalothece natronophila Z-M001]QDZ41655.1 hypothetical protein FRE64_16920 [Euhalothece natronophila Z-M001]